MDNNILDISSFYKEYAHYYNEISSDRDFNLQATCLLDILKKNSNILPESLSVVELFAGAAKHLICLSDSCIGKFYAIDSSDKMKSLFQKDNPNSDIEYLLKTLPCSNLPIDSNVDLIYCVRYSLGYLDRNNVKLLFEKVGDMLSENGVFVVETHCIDEIVANMSNTEIKRRRYKHFDKEISVEWPHSIEWSKDDFTANMTVLLESNDSSDCHERIMFSSVEHIYSSKELDFLAGLGGLKSNALLSSSALAQEAFNYSILKVYTK